MKIYLDDDSIDAVLIKLLQQAGHNVEVPADAGISGEKDPIHLTHAIQQQTPLLSRNHDDFRQLHDLIVASTGHHPGVLVVRFDNDKSRDLTHRGTVVALSKLLASGSTLVDSFHVLNHWR
jgi:hypothetical protein